MVSADNLLIYPDCKISFYLKIGASDKQLVAIISKNNKPIALFSGVLIKPRFNYNATDK